MDRVRIAQLYADSQELGGKVVKAVFLMELAGLNGRERLKGYDVESVICYEGK